MASEWYYVIDGKDIGPISSMRLKAMAASGEIQPTTLVWKEGLETWVAASKVKGLFPSKLTPTVTHPSTEDSIWLPNDELHPSDPSPQPQPEVEMPAEDVTVSAVTPRLPAGLSPADLIVQCSVAYRGGHPQHTEAAEGWLCFANNDLHFIATDSIHDLTISYRQVLDILNPVPGSFSREMIEKFERSKSLSSAGKQLSQFAGAFIGGFGGAAIRAIGASASGAAAAQNGLGAPPKNRLVVLIVENDVKHTLLFDVVASDKTEMETQAESCWRQIATVRSKFFKGANKPQPRAPGKAQPASTSSPTGYGFQVSRAGVVTGPHSEADIRAMLERGELHLNDTVRIEVWVPLATFGLLGMTMPSNNTPLGSTASRSANRAPDAKPQRSFAPAVAAGIGGLVVGGIASSLLTPASAHASHLSSSPDRDVQIQGVAMDSDGDGRIDTLGMDTNHDGRIDAVGIDRDGDGHIDALGMDMDHDGKLDTYGFDTDRDGDVDLVGHDYDEDGDLDQFDDV